MDGFQLLDELTLDEARHRRISGENATTLFGLRARTAVAR
jgi:hypothetical protein